MLREHQQREIFRRTRSMVFDSVPKCGEDHSVRAITSPLLSRADVQAAFDEISEKYHVAGIELTFSEHHSGNLQAIFAPSKVPRQHDGRTQKVGAENQGTDARRLASAVGSSRLTRS